MADHSIAYSEKRLEQMSLEQRSNGFTHKVTVKASDINNAALTADGDTATVKLLDTPVKWIVAKCAAVVRTAFATDGTLTAQVGTAADTDALIADTSVKTAGPIAPTAGAVPATAAKGATATAIYAIFSTQAETGALSDITAGEVDFYFQILDADKLD